MVAVKLPSAKNLKEITERGILSILPSVEYFKKALESRKRLSFYLGVDPTARALHIGNTVPLLFLRRLQGLGHRIVLLIGDFTARVGDPSNKFSSRKTLTEQEVNENMKSYKVQVGRVLSFSGSNPAEVVFNSSWLGKLSLLESLNIAQHITVQRLIERDMFKDRIKHGRAIFLNEFLYPFLQGYDSVALNVDGEVGGSDQLFNMLVGRDLLRTIKNKEKIVVSMDLLANPLTGKKMSKSEGMAIWLNDQPREMYGKIMNLPDSMVFPCFELCTDLPEEDIKQLKEQSKKGNKIRDAKAYLALNLVEMYHSKVKAKESETWFLKVFKNREFPKDASLIKLFNKEKTIFDLLTMHNLVSSRSEARRIITQGGVKLDGSIVRDWKALLPPNISTLQIGKRRF